MIDSICFKRVASKSIANLQVAFVDATPVGLVHKPKDTKTDKNFWRAYVGTGENARFLGHHSVRKDAENHVRWAYYAQNATVQVVENNTKMAIF